MTAGRPSPGLLRLLLLAPGLAFFALAVWEGYDLHAAVSPTAHWASVEGEVIWAGVDHERSFSRYGDGWRAVPDIRYRYYVNGRRLSGQRIYAGRSPEWRDEDEVEAFLADYPDDAPVVVHYDPANPGDAVLFREGSYLMFWFFVAMGCLFGLPGLAIVIFATGDTPRRRGKARKAG